MEECKIMATNKVGLPTKLKRYLLLYKMFFFDLFFHILLKIHNWYVIFKYYVYNYCSYGKICMEGKN